MYSSNTARELFYIQISKLLFKINKDTALLQQIYISLHGYTYIKFVQTSTYEKLGISWHGEVKLDRLHMCANVNDDVTPM